MFDIHAHFLPGVDDGAKDWETSLRMCEMAIQDGVKAVVCTPHANDTFAYDRSRLMEILTELKKKVGERLDLRLGCDFHLSFDNIRSMIKDPDQFAVAGTDYLLVEFSDFSIPPAIYDALNRFVSMGIRPIVTHPERNMLMQRRPETVLALARMGCVVQLTANSFTGRWGEEARRSCEWLIEHDCAHIIASDAHNLTSRPPVLSQARDIVARQYGGELAEALFVRNPQAVIYNQPLPYLPVPVA